MSRRFQMLQLITGKLSALKALKPREKILMSAKYMEALEAGEL